MLDRSRISPEVADMDEFGISDDFRGAGSGNRGVLLRHRADHLDEEQGSAYEPPRRLEED